jgi:hypothetical protein
MSEKPNGDLPCRSCGGSGWVSFTDGVHSYAGGRCRCVGGACWRSNTAVKCERCGSEHDRTGYRLCKKCQDDDDAAIMAAYMCCG